MSLSSPTSLSDWLQTTAHKLGFASLAISQPDLAEAKANHAKWIAAGFQGEMSYMERNGELRFAPAELVPETLSVISVIMPYLPTESADWHSASSQTLQDPKQAYISRYAHGRDYHKVVRSRLQKLAEALAQKIAPQTLVYRAFSDSAPVPEVEIASQTRLGWRGKHTLLLNRTHGSMFFLGELYVNLDLPSSTPAHISHCGQCRSCMDICPTQAIIAPYQLDARSCISYLTIEYHGSIPHEFRKAIGNRIYGCDDCQLACPWNRFAKTTDLPDFAVRNAFDHVRLLELLAWNETEFNEKTAGSAIRRIGHAQWQRNILLALGNAPSDPQIMTALTPFTRHDNPILSEQAQWSLQQHIENSVTPKTDSVKATTFIDIPIVLNSMNLG